MVLPFATLHDAWGINGMSRADYAGHAGHAGHVGQAKPRKGPSKTKVQNKFSSRALENIMDSYVDAPYRSSQGSYQTNGNGMLPGYSSDYAQVGDFAESYADDDDYSRLGFRVPSKKTIGDSEDNEDRETIEASEAKIDRKTLNQVQAVDAVDATYAAHVAHAVDAVHAGHALQPVQPIEDSRDIEDSQIFQTIKPIKEQDERRHVGHVGHVRQPNISVFFLEMLMYILSGVLLIFMMEQMVKLGANMRR